MKGCWWLLLFLMLESPAGAQTLSGRYERADSIARSLQGHSLEDVPGLTRKLTQSLTSDEEKFRAVYYWVCNNIENDYEGYLTNSVKRDKLRNDSIGLRAWQVKFNKQQVDQLIRHQRTVCTGYTNLVREMALHAGLECVSIDGYGRTAQAPTSTSMPNHSWNAVWLEGAWYLCDPTWSSGVVNAPEKKFLPEFFDGYFLAAPQLFIRSHYPRDTAWTLMADGPSLEEFYARPLIYRPAYKFQLTNISPDVFRISCARYEEIQFSFKQAVDAEVAVSLVVAKHGHQSAPKEASVLRRDQNMYEFTHRFTSRGVFALHVLINGEYTYTYEVTVL